MKILHVETGRQLLGGPQQVVYLMRGLADRGHDCTLVCPPGSGIDGAARQQGIPVRTLFCAGDIGLLSVFHSAQSEVFTFDIKEERKSYYFRKK